MAFEKLNRLNPFHLLFKKARDTYQELETTESTSACDDINDRVEPSLPEEWEKELLEIKESPLKSV